MTYMYMYMHVSCCVFLCTHASYNVLVFKKKQGSFWGFQKICCGFLKRLGVLKKNWGIPGFSGKSREIDPSVQGVRPHRMACMKIQCKTLLEGELISTYVHGLHQLSRFILYHAVCSRGINYTCYTVLYCDLCYSLYLSTIFQILFVMYPLMLTTLPPLTRQHL